MLLMSQTIIEPMTVTAFDYNKIISTCTCYILTRGGGGQAYDYNKIISTCATFHWGCKLHINEHEYTCILHLILKMLKLLVENN